MPFLAPIIGAIGTWWAGTAIGSFLATIGLTGKVLLTIGLNVASALIQQAMIKKPKGGVQFDRQYGGEVPRTVAIGLVGLPGHDCYINTYGKSNKFLQQIYTIADYPCDGLNRVAINGVWQTLSASEDPEKGFPVTSGDFANLIWIKFIDGNQTAANDFLVENANPAARWTEDHIGRGICYILVSMTYNAKKNSSFPDFFFEMRGSRLYDWRKDSTNGGSGSHRWADKTTHEFSNNPIVADYNYRRGFTVDGDLFCGMGMPAGDLPVDRYTIAANICDEIYEGAARYRVSLFLDTMSPHGDNIEALMLSCGGMVVDGVDGSWPIVGTDQPIVATITDDDLIVGAPINFQAKRSMSELVNSVSGNYPDPTELWSMIGYEAQIDTTAVTLDRRTRDLNLDFPQVPYIGQAEQLAAIYLEENRYEASASITIRPRWQGLEPGDWIEWGSARYGTRTYVVVESTLSSLETDGPRNVQLTLQERAGSIYDNKPPSVPTFPETPGDPDFLNEVEGFAVLAAVVEGDTGSKRPAIYASWDAIDDETVTHVELKYFPTGQPDSIFFKTVPVEETTVLMIEGVVRLTEYRVQTRPITLPERTTVFSVGLLVTTTDDGIGIGDLDPELPGTPTGLALMSVVQTDDPGYVKLTATWNANPVGEGIAYYDLEIKEGAGNYVSFQVAGLIKEFRVLSGTEIDARIRAVNKLGQASNFTAVVEHTAALDTVPPAVPTGFAAVGGFGIHWLSWVPNTEPDLKEYEIYRHTAATPVPLAGTAATFKVTGNQLPIEGYDPDVTRYYWIRAVDLSGNKSAWSSVVSATTVFVDVPDITPPTLGVPGVPVLTSAVALDPAGNPVTTVTADWTDGTNAVAYEIGIVEDGGTEVFFTSGGSVFQFKARAGILYVIRVRSIGAVGNKSAWTVTANITPVADTAAPATPTGLAAVAGFKAIWLTWSANTEADFKEYEIYQHSASSPAPVAGTAATYKTAGTTFVRTDLAAGTQRWFWIRAVDFSGNKSAWSASVNATATQIQTIDLAGAIDKTSVASGIAVVEYLAALPATGNFQGRTVFLTTNNKIYRHTGSPSDASGFTVAVDGGDITALSITAAKIAVGAIGADQIAANAIRTKHLLITDFYNFIKDPFFADSTSGEFTLGAGVTYVSGLGLPYQSSTTCLRFTGGVAYTAGRFIPCVPGNSYTLEGVARRNSVDGGLNAQIWFMPEDASTILGFVTLTWTTADANLAWLSKSASGICPDGAVKMRVVFSQSSTISGSYDLAQVSAYRQVDSVLIKDGAITAAKVSTNEIITSSANIANAVITSAKIVSLSAAQIEAGTVLSGEVIVGGRAIGTLNTEMFSDDFSSANSGAVVSETVIPGAKHTWTTSDAIGSASFLASATAQSGPNVLRISGTVRVFNKLARIPYDPNKMYRIRIRLRRVSSTVAGAISVGVQGLTGDGTTSINPTTGAEVANGTNAHWCVMQQFTSASLPGAAAWVTYEGYIKGTGTTPTGVTSGTAGGSIAAPTKMQPNTRFISPIIGNNQGGTGDAVIDVDYFAIHQVDEDAAAIVNAGTVKILPGSIEISGGTTLADWRQGGDTTKIAGGSISTNTISANKLTVGLRNVQIEGLQFEHNSPSSNRVSWTAGTIRYTNDAGVLTSAAITANAVGTLWSTGVLYVYWVQGASTLSTTTTAATAYGTNNVVLAAYQGGVDLTVDIGRTIIDGSGIKTGTITADQIAAASIRTRHLLIGNPDNLVPNPRFEDAGFGNWQIPGGAAFQSVVLNNAVGVPAGAPTTYVAKWDGVAAAGAAISIMSHDQIWNQAPGGITCAPGENYRFSIDAVRVGTVTGALGVYAYGYRADGTPQTAIAINFATTAITTAWASYSGNIVIPANWQKFYLYFIWNPPSAATIYWTNARINKRNEGSLIVDGAITADHVSTNEIITVAANIKDAIITNAKILNLDAAKITTGFLAAARIEAGSIDTSKITISGATTLSDWRQGGDLTRIAGGSISANTVDANKLTIGLRNIKVVDVQFEHNSPSSNRVTWTSGFIQWYNDSGVLTNSTITANAVGVLYTAPNAVYLYWDKTTPTVINSTTSSATAYTANTVVLAIYRGGTLLTVDIGRTIIDGSGIKTGTITATQLITTAALITASAQIANAVITSTKRGNLEVGSI